MSKADIDFDMLTALLYKMIEKEIYKLYKSDMVLKEAIRIGTERATKKWRIRHAYKGGS